MTGDSEFSFDIVAVDHGGRLVWFEACAGV